MPAEDRYRRRRLLIIAGLPTDAIYLSSAPESGLGERRRKSLLENLPKDL
jgi:hypothetical protein